MAWNEEKLDALRAKFSGDTGGTAFDEHFREISRLIFGKGGYCPAPYCPRHAHIPGCPGAHDAVA